MTSFSTLRRNSGALGLPALMLAAIILCCSARSATATPIYSVSAVACGVSGNFSGPTPGIIAATGSQSCGSLVGVSGIGIAGSGGVGASAQGQYVCCGASGGGQGFGKVETEFIVTGPGSSVVLSLNLAFHGVFGGGVTNGGTSVRSAELRVNIGATGLVGILFERVQNNQTDGGGIGQLVFNFSGHGACSPCLGTTPTLTVPTNTPIFLSMSILASVDNGVADIGGFVNASSTFYFPLNGPVFNLPAGYTASIAGLNVENNAVVGTAESVPEPSTFVILGAGLALLAGVQSQRVRRR